MKVQLGEIKLDTVESQSMRVNRTRRYLLPCLADYGELFTKKLEAVFKIAAGVGDIIVETNGKAEYEKHIFILLDSKIANIFFIDFLEWIKDQPMYEDDYVYGDIQKSTFHMVVIRFPEKFYNSYDRFKKGSYSQMFSRETIDTFFRKNSDVQKIFIKDHSYKIVFTRKVNRIFGTTLNPEDWEPNEYDLPPTAEGEKFNDHLKK